MQIMLKNPTDCALWNADQTVSVEADERGESDYEAYNLVCRNKDTGHIVWIEGIQKNRKTMYPEWSAIVEPALHAAKAQKV